MQVKPPIYGLHLAVRSGVIDTPSLFDEAASPTEALVIDPFDSVIVGAGISTVDGDEFYDGAEHGILSALDRRFAMLEPGIFATWNGSILDLPLLGARARALQLNLGLRIRPDGRRALHAVGNGWPTTPAAPPPYQVGRSATGGTRPVSGAWHGQRHLDLRWVGACSGPSDPCRGAHQARSLAERRWGRARRHLDRFPQPASGSGGPMTTALAMGAGDSLEASRARHPSNVR